MSCSIWKIINIVGWSQALPALSGLIYWNQKVVGLDNFSTGYRHNLEQIKELAGEEAWLNFEFIEGDIRQLEVCRNACRSVDYVLHEAALGSVPRSIQDPIRTNENNISGFLNLLVESRDASVKHPVPPMVIIPICLKWNR